MNVLKPTSGRKRDSPIWGYFAYDAPTDKSRCTALDNGMECGRILMGKNPTNLATHLRTAHKEVYAEYMTRIDQWKAAAKPVPKASASTSQSSSSAAQQGGGRMQSFLTSPKRWPVDSNEAKVRDESLCRMVVMTGVPARLVDQNDFKEFCKKLDPKYEVPGVTRLNGLIHDQMESVKAKVKEMLAASRKITIGADIWTKKGLTMSFLGVSAAFYDPGRGTAVHVMLNLHEIPHPHTGEAVAEKLQMSIQEWDIDPQKILMVVTDNGSNMLKAIRMLREWAETDDADTDTEEDISSADETPEQNSDDKVLESPLRFVIDNYHRLPCLAHSLQLVIHCLNKIPTYNHIMTKARSIVRTVRISSVATQHLQQKEGRTVCADCPTRWNSSYLMLKRLLDIRPGLTEVFEIMGWDSLLASEWQKIDEVCTLLQPFYEHTRRSCRQIQLPCQTSCLCFWI